MTDLERRYRWLLKAYPRSYREYRADEILEIVLAGADEKQRRPSVRESWALVVGGLRARTGVDRLDARAARSSTLRLCTLALLIYGLTRWTETPISWLAALSSEHPYPILPWHVVMPTTLAIAILMTAWGRYRSAFGAMVVAVLTSLWEVKPWSSPGRAEYFWYGSDTLVWSLLLPLLALLPLLRAPRRAVTRPWIWPLLGVLAVAASTPNPINGWSDAPTMSLYAFALLAVVAAPIDARMPAVAFTLLLVPALTRATFHVLIVGKAPVLSISGTPLLILVGLMAATLAAGMIAGRRQARV
ncbi:hypothetical protein [Plantactinospora endophytica]|uniref:Acyltransferase n=1 Tax=Plantactinospora endophytica TaxID=673535 RepID=A0ABQ4DZZ4_9ACTN|nr:hypothetical protein [Plantactinospora endophytica]GIG88011.1 hypothetical protein Pen02_29470 [Plantactinospora endophytica]